MAPEKLEPLAINYDYDAPTHRAGVGLTTSVAPDVRDYRRLQAFANPIQIAGPNGQFTR
jgi:hypothetical protein